MTTASIDIDFSRPSDPHQPTVHGLTVRAVAIGLLLAFAIGAGGAYFFLYLQGSNAGNAFYVNPVAHALFFLLVGVVNVVVGVIHRPWALRRAELIAVYIIMILANGTHTLLLSWVCVMPAYFYYATPENNWAVLVHPYILDWLVVQDPEAIEPFYEASEGDAAGVPWQAWLGPLLSWLPLIIALHVGTLSLMVVLRRQWVERERLIYPLAQVPLAMIQDDERDSLIKPFFRSGVMWTGFAVTFFIGVVKGLHAYYPFIPTLNMGTTLPLFHDVGIRTEISFATVGFFILIHREIAFSLWVFSLLNIIQKGLYGVLGISWVQEPTLSAWSYNIPDLVHQSMGGMIVLVLGGLWVGREHLALVMRKALGRADHVNDDDEIISYRGAVVGLVGSAFILILWLWLSGIPLVATLTFLFFVLVVFVSLTRVAAEGGVAVIYPPLVPPDAAMSAIGTAPFGTQGLVSLLFTRIWANDILNYSMPHCANGLKLGDEIGQRRRWLFAVMLLAILFGLAGGLWALLHLAYEYGALNLRPRIFNWLPSYYADFAAARVLEASGPAWWGWFHTVVGSLVMGLLMLARHHWVWWPLHPLGFPISSTFSWMAFNAFLAWLIKGVVVKYGGRGLYRTVRPFFLGMILGHFTVYGVFWAIDSFTGMVGNSVGRI